MVMLPGIGDHASDYARHGLVHTAQSLGLDADLLAVDAHYAYYARDEIVDRLYAEIIAPAREHYAEVWLVGISLGGLGAIMTAQAHPEAVDGLVLLAPYLGPSHMPRTILAEGGMRAWEPPPPPTAYDWDVSLWTWLKRYEQPDSGLPPLYIAYGRQDSLALGHALVAEILPADHVIVSDGAHYWDTWAGLWERMVQQGLAQLRVSTPAWRPEPRPALRMETAPVMAASAP
jgi:pimeloyl-ACP methyl ester carboxylesterase